MIKHPRAMLGGIGVVLALVAGVAIWATAYNLDSNNKWIQAYQIEHGGH